MTPRMFYPTYTTSGLSSVPENESDSSTAQADRDNDDVRTAAAKTTTRVSSGFDAAALSSRIPRPIIIAHCRGRCFMVSDTPLAWTHDVDVTYLISTQC